MSASLQTSWTAEQDTQLIQLVAAGHSFSQIGASFGRSRSAAIGRAYRLGLTAPREKKPKPRALHWTGFPKRKSPDRKPPMVVDNHQSPKIECVPLNVPFLELELGQCKYPHGDSLPYLFCGLPSENDGPYCHAHFNATHNRHARGYERPDYTYNLRKQSGSRTVLHSNTIDPTNPEQLPDVA